MLAAPSGGGRGRARSALVAPAGLRQTETRAPLRSGDGISHERSTNRFTSRAEASYAANWPATCARDARSERPGAAAPSAAAESPRWCRSPSDRPRSTSAGCRVTGRAICSWQAKPFLRRHPGRAPYPLRDVGSAGLDRTTENVTRALKQRIPSCPTISSSRSPGIRETSSPRISAFGPRPGSTSTSATPTRPGNGAQTKTPTACFANTCRRVLTSPSQVRRS